MKVRRPRSLNRAASVFRSDVITGLSGEPKRLACKYFYDEIGSALFDAICELDEYYPTRTELAIMDRYAPEMAELIGAGATLIEFGSGSSIKTRLLLDQLEHLAAYVPVDISRQHLLATARRLSRRYPAIAVRPVHADFTERFSLPPSQKTSARRVVYFPGSTIGNFERADAVALLERIAALCGPDGGLLVGIDLEKDVGKIEAAYNDARGVTAQFNLNLLSRINRELGGDFNLEQFEHVAFYDQADNRVDIRLASLCEQRVQIGSDAFDFRVGETILTEYSHKYTIQRFEQMACEANLRLRTCWMDEQRYFAVLFFEVA